MKCILYKKALPLILLSCLLLGACGNSKNDSVSKEPLSHTSTEKGTWDSAPKVLTPTADGTQTYSQYRCFKQRQRLYHSELSRF